MRNLFAQRGKCLMFGFTTLDLILVIIMLLSGFLAMLRGLTREILSILSWAVAALASLFVYANYKEWARHFVDQKMHVIADVALVGVVFVIVLLLVEFFTLQLSNRVLDSRVGALDRTLGFAFGLVRGLLLVVICYLLFYMIVQKDKAPAWVTEAKSLKVIESIGDGLLSLLPDNPESIFRGNKPAGGGEGAHGALEPRSNMAVAYNQRYYVHNRLGADSLTVGERLASERTT
jgi:membrane protein required for colicin V production